MRRISLPLLHDIWSKSVCDYDHVILWSVPWYHFSFVLHDRFKHCSILQIPWVRSYLSHITAWERLSNTNMAKLRSNLVLSNEMDSVILLASINLVDTETFKSERQPDSICGPVCQFVCPSNCLFVCLSDPVSFIYVAWCCQSS